MLAYQDDVTVIFTEVDEEGTETISEQEIVPAIVDLNTGYQHGDHADFVTSDARVYLDPTNDFVISHNYRMEEALIVIDTFGSEQRRNWYKVEKCIVSRDTQLCNQVDNVELLLKKVHELKDVS